MSNTDKAAWLMNRGTELFQQGMYQEAATNYSAAVKLMPEDESTVL